VGKCHTKNKEEATSDKMEVNISLLSVEFTLLNFSTKSLKWSQMKLRTFKENSFGMDVEGNKIINLNT